MENRAPSPPRPVRATSVPHRGARSCAGVALASLAVLGLLMGATAPALAAPGSEAASAPGGPVEYPLPRGERCKPTIEVSASQVLAGEPVTVSGELRCAGTDPLGQTVTLFAHSPGGPDGFATVATATSEANGSYEIPAPALTANTIFFVRAGGGHSARRRVVLSPSITLVAPLSGSQLLPGARDGSEPATNTVTFTGIVAPALAGELVVLQRERPSGSSKWRRIAVTHTGEAGDYAITHTFRRPGEAVVRVVVRSRGRLAPAMSAPLTYEIAPRTILHPARLRAARSARS